MPIRSTVKYTIPCYTYHVILRTIRYNRQWTIDCRLWTIGYVHPSVLHYTILRSTTSQDNVSESNTALRCARKNSLALGDELVALGGVGDLLGTVQ